MTGSFINFDLNKNFNIKSHVEHVQKVIRTAFHNFELTNVQGIVIQLNL